MRAEPPNVVEQETQVLQALSTAATVRIDGAKMEFRTADGALYDLAMLGEQRTRPDSPERRLATGRVSDPAAMGRFERHRPLLKQNNR